MAISSKAQTSEASNGDPRSDDSDATPPVDDSPSEERSDHDETEDEGGESLEEGEQIEAPPLPDEAVPPLPTEEAPPLPEEAPPLPAEAPPGEDDGWEPKWDDRAQAYYFFNRFTNISQWENPRVPETTQPPPPGLTTESAQPTPKPITGGYDPAIHGDYDPTAAYAQVHASQDEAASSFAPGTDPVAAYAATGAFNRFTGKWQNAALNPENFNDENKSKRQMNAFFDVDAAANSHDGKSLKAERASKKLSKQELKAFKERRRERKEEKRRAWLLD